MFTPRRSMMVLQIESPNRCPGQVVQLTKCLNTRNELNWCNAHTRIGDVECYILAFLAIPVTDVPGGGELEGIAYQIGNDLVIRFLSPSITIFSSEGSETKSSGTLRQRRYVRPCISCRVDGGARVMVNSTDARFLFLISRGFQQ